MTTLHTEAHDDGHTRIEVRQEWPGAGLHWYVEIDGNGILPTFKHRSGGCFYQDAPGEVIHGETLDDVIKTAARGARAFLKLEAW